MYALKYVLYGYKQLQDKIVAPKNVVNGEIAIWKKKHELLQKDTVY